MLVVASRCRVCLYQDGIKAFGLGWGQEFQGENSLADLTKEKHDLSDKGQILCVKEDELLVEDKKSRRMSA